jgi:hypothetical protein
MLAQSDFLSQFLCEKQPKCEDYAKGGYGRREQMFRPKSDIRLLLAGRTAPANDLNE